MLTTHMHAHMQQCCQRRPAVSNIKQACVAAPPAPRRGSSSSGCDFGRRTLPAVCRSSFGSDVVSGWLDLAKLVASEGSKAKGPYDELAFKIGRDVYVDIAGWHLFLRDMNAVPGFKMSQALATQLGPEAAGSGRSGMRESDVAAVLKKIPVELGAGKTRVSLFDVMPSMCVSDLVKILDDFARDS